MLSVILGKRVGWKIALPVAVGCLVAGQSSVGWGEASAAKPIEAFANNPMRMEDPGVPEAGQLEANFLADMDLTSSSKDYDPVVLDANFGFNVLNQAFQINYSLPYSVSSGVNGFGRQQLGIKWNFYDQEGISSSIFPKIQTEVPWSGSVKRSDSTFLHQSAR